MKRTLNMTYAEQPDAEGTFVRFACNVLRLIRSGGVE